MSKDFYAIGHITNDLEPFPHVGGGVTYSSVVAKRLGFTPHIITKCDQNSPYIKELEEMGIQVSVLPVRNQKFLHTTTSFTNLYDETGKRTQVCPQQQEEISEEDIKNFPEIHHNATILIAPVIGEVAPSLFESLALKGQLALTPQGYFREILPDGKVIQKSVKDVSFFACPQVTILSEEDLAFDDGSFFQDMKNICPMIIKTQGETGSAIYKRGQNPMSIPAFHLEKNEIVDFTGAGDSYATAFLLKKAEGLEDKEAGLFASLFAALKIAGIGGGDIGLSTIPTAMQVEKYIKENGSRVSVFSPTLA